jgi:SAM-dependent methyltransferase
MKLPLRLLFVLAPALATASCGGRGAPPASGVEGPVPAGSDAPAEDTTPASAHGTDDPDGATEAPHGTGAAPAHGHGQGHSHGFAMDFSAVERFAAHFDSAERDAWQRPGEVLGLLQLTPTSIVVDLGAGTGYFLPHLSRATPSGRVLALDAEPNMVRYMQQRVHAERLPNVEARVVPGDDPGLEPGSVDRILIVNTWHHLSDRTRYARKLAASLRPGGAIMIVDFTEDAPMGPPRPHRLAAERVVRELVDAGLTARVVEENLPHQYVVVGAAP